MAFGLSNIRLGLSSQRGGDRFAVLGFSPETVYDAATNTFRADETATNFAGLFTFSRASEATYFDSNGALQTAASGVARTDHHVFEGGVWKKGLLVEPAAATNLVPESNDLTAWDNNYGGGTTLTAAAAIGPDRASSLTRVARVDSNSDAVNDAVTIAASTVYTLSCFVRAGTSTRSALGIFDNNSGSNWVSLNFDWTSGVPSTQSATGSGSPRNIRYEHYGGGLYRVSVTFTSAATITFSSVFFMPERNGLGTENAFAGFFQLEAGDVPTSYVATSGAAATRNAEALSIAAANLPVSGGMPAAVSIAMDGWTTYADADSFATARTVLWRADDNNIIAHRIDTATTDVGKFVFSQDESGTQDFVLTAGDYLSPGLNVKFNVASRHGATFINAATDGTALTANETPTALPDLSSANLVLADIKPCVIRSFRLWAADIGEAGIEEASGPF